MGLRRQAHLCMVPLLLALSGVSIAGTVSTVGMEATGMFDEGGITSCGYSSATTASCSVGANNYDPFGGELVTAGTSASSAFGALSGSLAPPNLWGHLWGKIIDRFQDHYRTIITAT